MITMEEAVNNLLQQGTITQEEAMKALAKADDEGLGSAPVDEASAEKSVKSLADPKAASLDASGKEISDEDDEGYSF